jgi:flagellar biosynthesis protein FlhF
MKIRRFFAPDMRRAIQMVRNEQGADAVILSSRAVDGGVEIVSAVDYDQELIAQMTRPAASAGGIESKADRAVAAEGIAVETAALTPVGAAEPAADDAAATRSAASAEPSAAATAATAAEAVAPSGTAAATVAAPAAAQAAAALAAPAAPAAAPSADAVARIAAAAESAAAAASELPIAAAVREERGLAALRTELEAMKCMLREQLAHMSWADMKMRQPERALLATRVARLGLDPELAEALVAEVEHPENAGAWREIMFGLARRLRVPKSDPLEEGGVFALVGPTGVGKTTTIAKLAARHCLRFGRESIGLISTDTLRVGAQRQLDAFAAILGVPVRPASDVDELNRLLHALRDRRLVLIDTAGMAPRDRRLADALQQLDSVRSIRRYLVLAANMQPGVMDDAVRAFGAAGLAGAVLTKLDEANGLGAALSVLVRQKLRAVWLSHGQRVPEDLRVANGLHLLRWAFDREAMSDADALANPRYLARRDAAGVTHAAV